MAELPGRRPLETTENEATLSQRGAKLSASGAVLDIFRDILSNTFHPETNEKGIINAGTSENVTTFILSVERFDSDRITVPHASGGGRLCF